MSGVLHPKCGKRAHPWSLWAMYRDTAARTHPGRHQANTSPTHVPAWPFNRKAS